MNRPDISHNRKVKALGNIKSPLWSFARKVHGIARPLRGHDYIVAKVDMRTPPRNVLTSDREPGLLLALRRDTPDMDIKLISTTSAWEWLNSNHRAAASFVRQLDKPGRAH